MRKRYAACVKARGFTSSAATIQRPAFLTRLEPMDVETDLARAVVLAALFAAGNRYTSKPDSSAMLRS